MGKKKKPEHKRNTVQGEYSDSDVEFLKCVMEMLDGEDCPRTSEKNKEEGTMKGSNPTECNNTTDAGCHIPVAEQEAPCNLIGNSTMQKDCGLICTWAAAAMGVGCVAAGILIAEMFLPFGGLLNRNTAPIAHVRQEAYDRGFIHGFELGQAAEKASSAVAFDSNVNTAISEVASMQREIEDLQDKLKLRLEFLGQAATDNAQSAKELLEQESGKIQNQKKGTAKSFKGNLLVKDGEHPVGTTVYVIPEKRTEDILYSGKTEDRKK